jgi:hypothetical protein
MGKKAADRTLLRCQDGRVYFFKYLIVAGVSHGQTMLDHKHHKPWGYSFRFSQRSADRACNVQLVWCATHSAGQGTGTTPRVWRPHGTRHHLCRPVTVSVCVHCGVRVSLPARMLCRRPNPSPSPSRRARQRPRRRLGRACVVNLALLRQAFESSTACCFGF